MRSRGFATRTCPDCGEELIPNSAVFDGYGRERWYCPNCDGPGGGD